MFSIYIIQNILNYKMYVGKAANPIRRYTEHKSIANGAKPREFSLIHAAIKKHGKDNFTFNVMEEWENEQDAYDAEMFWINFFCSDVSRFGKEAGYNVNEGGRGAGSGAANPMFGKTHTDEVKARMSAQRKGELNANFGKHFSDEIKQVMSEKKQDIYLGDNNPRALLTNIQAEEIRTKFATKTITIKALAIEYGVRKAIIYRILKNETYKGKI